MSKHHCKHFTGHTTLDKKGCCAAGVCYDDVTPDPDEPGNGLRRPCIDRPFSQSESHLDQFRRRGTCDKFQLPTEEELKQEEREADESLNRIRLGLQAVAMVRKQHKGENWQGVIECPCCKGKLHVRHAGCNGHVHAKCETEDCISWME